MGKRIVKEFPVEEPVVSMIQFNGQVFLATTRRVYKLVDEQFIPLDVVELEVDG